MASAVPSEVFWHVVYSSVCKHHYVYARSRRTSGQPWRPLSGPRPPLLYAAARSSSPVPRDSQPPRLHTNSAVPIKRSATPFMRSTSGGLAVLQPLSSRPHTPVDHLRCRDLRVPPSTPPSKSADIRQADQPVDPRAGRRGQFRPGPYPTARQRPAIPAEPASPVFTGSSALAFRKP
jgi:hypothetical protein